MTISGASASASATVALDLDKPIATLFELELALSPERSWDGTYIADFRHIVSLAEGVEGGAAGSVGESDGAAAKAAQAKATRPDATDGTLVAKIDRPAKIIQFTPPKPPEEALSDWAADISKMLTLVDNTCHLINKEHMVHKVREESNQTAVAARGARPRDRSCARVGRGRVEAPPRRARAVVVVARDPSVLRVVSLRRPRAWRSQVS